jgi:photosystem II stability/assembly factor-like uncharacterized protein
MRSPLRLLFAFIVFFLYLACFAEGHSSAATNSWKVVEAPFRLLNITAQGATLWVCGVDETISSSADGGATWQTRHQNLDGEVLFDIAFVNDKIGHAAGTGGILLSTDDGGETWKRHTVPGVLRLFSFANAMNGITVVDERTRNLGISSSDQASPVEGTVKITHDGGENWEDVQAINSEELRPFAQTLSVTALDDSHFLLLRRQPEVEDVFLVTKDGGKSWKAVHPQNDATNRALPRMVFVHEGEYWAYGHELVHREKGGGYGVPLALHSKDGETWIHGAAGPNEFDSCTSQGCYMWDGVVEDLYGEHEQFWAFPQDGSLSKNWAIAGSAGCTISHGALKCSSVHVTEKPPSRPEEPGGIIFVTLNNQHLTDGCLDCRVEGIIPDSPVSASIHPVRASIKVHRDGTVANVSVDYPASKRMSDEITSQLSKWLFEPWHDGSRTVEAQKDVTLVLMCSGFPGRPETNRCTLHSSDEFSRFRSPSGGSTSNSSWSRCPVLDCRNQCDCTHLILCLVSRKLELGALTRFSAASIV